MNFLAEVWGYFLPIVIAVLRHAGLKRGEAILVSSPLANVKNNGLVVTRHPGEGRGPERIEKTGFRPTPE